MAEQSLSDKAKEVRREYAKRWRAQNRDKVSAANKRYWEKKADKMMAQEVKTNAETQGV